MWLSNRDYIETHNKRYEAGLESYSLKMNHFGDLPLEEFKAIYLTKKSDSDTSQCTGSQAPTDKVPTAVDWSAKGAITNVKDQGDCGSCWAFSVTGALEGLYFEKNKKMLNFSEQQLVDCSRGYKN